MIRFEKSNHRKVYCIKCNKYKNLKTLIYHIFSITQQFSLLFVRNAVVNIKKVFRGEESIEILKILGFIKNIGESANKYVLTLKNIFEEDISQ